MNGLGGSISPAKKIVARGRMSLSTSSWRTLAVAFAKHISRRGRIRILSGVLQHLLDAPLLHLGSIFFGNAYVLLDSQGDGIKPRER